MTYIWRANYDWGSETLSGCRGNAVLDYFNAQKVELHLSIITQQTPTPAFRFFKKLKNWLTLKNFRCHPTTLLISSTKIIYGSRTTQVFGLKYYYADGQGFDSIIQNYFSYLKIVFVGVVAPSKYNIYIYIWNRIKVEYKNPSTFRLRLRINFRFLQFVTSRWLVSFFDPKMSTNKFLIYIFN